MIYTSDPRLLLAVADTRDSLNSMGHFDEIEAEFYHIMDELKRVADFHDRKLLLLRMGELIKETQAAINIIHRDFLGRRKPPKV